ncbi:MAG: hypothetical protein NVS3B14_19480 [Ktedonobacteraceae bacterium]
MNEEKQEGGEAENRPPDGLLNANHRRVLANTLRRVELAAWRLEDQLLRGDPPQLALTRFTHAPDSKQRSALLQMTRQIRQEVAKLASEYQLEAGEWNLVRTIMSEFTLLWSDLEDTRPQKLRAYGAINPLALTILGPRIQNLIDLALAIERAAGQY